MVALMETESKEFNVFGFSADDEMDLQYLPTTTSPGKDYMSFCKPVHQGSWCIVFSTTDVYFLRSDDTWQLA